MAEPITSEEMEIVLDILGQMIDLSTQVNVNPTGRRKWMTLREGVEALRSLIERHGGKDE